MQQLLNAGAHKVHDSLWRVDNAVCVRLLDRKSVKKALIHHIQKRLFGTEILYTLGVIFNCVIDRIEVAEKTASAKRPTGQCLYDTLNLCCYHIASHKIGVVEHRAEEPLGEQMLHEHFFYHITRNVGMQRLFAEGVEGVECLHKPGVVGKFLFNALYQPLRQAWDALLKFAHSTMEFLNICASIGEKARQELCQLLTLPQVYFENTLAILIEHT